MKWPAILLLSSSLLVGCHSQPKAPSRKTLRLNFHQEPTTIDPRKGGDITSSAIQFLLYEGLEVQSPKGVIGGISEFHKISKDQRIYTFYLKETYWSNGDPVTAYDFERAWQSILSPDFPAPHAYLLYPIKNAKKVKRSLLPKQSLGIKAIDARTFQVELEYPVPYFLELISFCVFSPTHYSFDVEKSSVITNGPFRIKSWQRSGCIVLEKNPYYWNKDSQEIEELVISLVEDENTAFHLYEQGQLDLIGIPYSSVPMDSLKELRESDALHKSMCSATTFCLFNVEKYPFHNKNMRKAFSYAINRKELIEHVLQGGEDLALDFVHPTLKNGKSDTLFEDDAVEKARYHLKLALQELGITKEELGTIHFLHCYGEKSIKIVQALQDQWRKTLGVTVEIITYDSKTFLDKLITRNFQIGISRWFAQYQDPMTILDRFSHSDNSKNYCGWYNKEYINLLKSSFEAGRGPQRKKLLVRAEEILAEEMPLTPLYHWNALYLKHPKVKNVELLPIGGFDFLHAKVEEK